MEKYELISKLEVNPKKSLKDIDKFLTNFNEWDEYKDEYIGNEKIAILNKEYWNEDYLSKHISLLFSNFSKKRLEHIKEVIEYLYSDNEDEEIIENEIGKKKLYLQWILIIFLIILGIRYFKYKNQNSMETNITKEQNQTNLTKKIDNNQTIKKQINKDLNTTKIQKTLIKNIDKNNTIKEKNMTKEIKEI